MKFELTEILTNLFDGNVGEARQQAESVLYDNTYSLTEERDRIRQDKANFDLAKLHRTCYND